MGRGAPPLPDQAWRATAARSRSARNAKGDCEQPKEPRIELDEAEKLYIELHDKFPTFRRMDLVTYLIGFAAKEDNREDEAMAKFQEVIEQVPAVAAVRRRVDDGRRALLRRDAVAEGDATRTRTSPTTPRPSDLATFKTAWCDWKLGDTDQAARRLQARARQGRRGRAHRHRGAAPPQRLAARRGARVPRRRVHRGPLDLGARRCSTSSRRSAASTTRATS